MPSGLEIVFKALQQMNAAAQEQQPSGSKKSESPKVQQAAHAVKNTFVAARKDTQPIPPPITSSQRDELGLRIFKAIGIAAAIAGLLAYLDA